MRLVETIADGVFSPGDIARRTNPIPAPQVVTEPATKIFSTPPAREIVPKETLRDILLRGPQKGGPQVITPPADVIAPTRFDDRVFSVMNLDPAGFTSDPLWGFTPVADESFAIGVDGTLTPASVDVTGVGQNGWQNTLNSILNSALTAFVIHERGSISPAVPPAQRPVAPLVELPTQPGKLLAWGAILLVVAGGLFLAVRGAQ